LRTLAILALSTLAYVRSADPKGRILAWQTPDFSLRVGAAVPKGVTRQAMLDAARAAARAWNEVDCAAVHIEIEDGGSVVLPVREDGVNAVVPHLMTWCADERGTGCHDNMNPALTTTRFRPGTQKRTATIHEVDVELNAVDYRWDDLKAPNGADLQTILTHELGHALGLADACRMPGAAVIRDDQGAVAPDCTASPSEVRASVMWPLGAPNDLRRRALSPEDRRAICALYPKREGHR